MSFNTIAAYIISLSVAVPAATGVFVFRKISKSLRLIVVLMIAGLITEVCLIVTAMNGKTNHHIINVFSILEILLLTFYFVEIIVNQRAKQVIKFWGIIAGLLFLVEMMFSGISLWNSFSSMIESLTIIFFGLYFFYEVALAITPTEIRKNPDYWITAILVFYFLSSIEYYFLQRYLSKASPDSLMLLGKIHVFVNAFCNLAIAAVLWIYTRSYSLYR